MNRGVAGETDIVFTLRARDFPVVREVTTSSWLGLAHHRQGYGTEARRSALSLAFEQLGAEAALTVVFQDKAASQGVSSKLGPAPGGPRFRSGTLPALQALRKRAGAPRPGAGQVSAHAARA